MTISPEMYREEIKDAEYMALIEEREEKTEKTIANMDAIDFQTLLEEQMNR